MALKLGDLFNKSLQKLSGGDKSVFSNPIWVAAITISVLLIIIWFVMKDEVETVYEGSSFLTLLIKVGIWGFIANLLIAFLHDRSIDIKYENKHKNKMQEQIVSKVIGEPNISSQPGAVGPSTES